MRLPIFIAAATFALSAGFAYAKITAAEAKSTFFGLDMGGVYEPDGAPWRECISPDGQTHYWFDGYNDIGRLTIRADGALCFAYASREYKDTACFTAERKNKGWRFVSVSNPDVVFLAQRATKTKVCSNNAPNA
jgi:hypothetical protein